MQKTFNFFYALLLAVFGLGITLIAEEITLTTYYPAPYGAYEELAVDRNLENNSAAITGINIDIDETGTNSGTVSGLNVDVSGVASGTVRSAIFQGGNVGIGTSAPISNLYVYQNSPSADQILLGVGTSGAALRFAVDEDGDVGVVGRINAAEVDAGAYYAGAVAGVTGTFTDKDNKAVIVTKGIITSIGP